MKTTHILVTGCCGTIGHALMKDLVETGATVLGIDNNESGLFSLEQEFGERARLYFADIRDRRRMHELMAGIDQVFHTAALKHVGSCEISPSEAIKTNILGVDNIIAAARRNGVGRVLFTSSDKAANPTNVMGTSKLMGERLMTAATSGLTGDASDGPIFISTRFGNVLGSHGSVFPLFQAQIKAGGPVTLTDARMTRFVMSTADAVRLVRESMELGHGGEVFVSRMHALAIRDLAAVMIRHLAPRYGHAPEDIELRILGARPGEKFHEELLTDEESHRCLALDKFFVILPAFKDFYSRQTYEFPDAAACSAHSGMYRSDRQTLMTQEEIAAYLMKNGLLPTRP